jgi:hypothetical protein
VPDGDRRTLMLAIPVPALPGSKYRRLQADLGAEYLVLVLAPEGLLEGTDLLEQPTADQDSGRDGSLIL